MPDLKISALPPSPPLVGTEPLPIDRGSITYRTTTGDVARFHDRVVDARDYGGTGDGITDDTAAIQAAVDACATTGGITYLAAGTWVVSSPILLARGVILLGATTFDPEHGTVLRLADGANCPMLWTPGGASGDPLVGTGDGTHFMGIDLLVLDGNGDNQASDNIAVKMWGNFVGGFIGKILVKDNRGPALSLWYADIDVDLLWAVHTRITDGVSAAVMVGDPDTTIVPGISSAVNFKKLFIEHTQNAMGLAEGDSQSDPTKRADGLRIERTNMVSIVGGHFENNKRDVVFGPSVGQVDIDNFDSIFSDGIFHFEAMPAAAVQINNARSQFATSGTPTMVGSDVAGIGEEVGTSLTHFLVDPFKAAHITPSSMPEGELFVPAANFSPQSGLTAIDLIGTGGSGGTQGWNMSDVATRTVVHMREIPPWWKTFAVDLWHMNNGAGSGDVKATVQVDYYTVGGANPSTIASNTDAITVGAQSLIEVESGRIASVTRATGTSRLHRFVVSRLGGDGADTLTNAWTFIGLNLRRLT